MLRRSRFGHHVSDCRLFVFSFLLLLLQLSSFSSFFILSSEAVPLVHHRDECGKQRVRGPRIVGGENSYAGEYPWTVSVRLNNKHFCGGVLLNRYWILTAAHCVAGYGAKNFQVRLGAFKLKADDEDDFIDVPVDNVTVHQNYSRPRPFANDIALLRLDQRVEYTDYINSICLPKKADETDGDFYSGMKGTVVGWGWINDGSTYDGRGEHAKVLQKVNLPVVPNEECTSWYRAKGKIITISSKQFCAGFKHGGKDACRGDSGGPMLMKDPLTERFMVVGIVSAGIGCALPDLPGLYTRVNAYIPWISQQVNDRQYCLH